MEQHTRKTCGCVADDRRHAAARRVALTGGPGAGKTAVLEVVRKHFCDHVVVLPEAATIVFGGGFPRLDAEAARRRAQLAIFHVQDQMESLEFELGRAALVLCDRGVPDGLAYWPGDEASFWEAVGSPKHQVLSRYVAVLHLRPPSEARGYKRDNPLRIESGAEAARVDARIEQAWDGHPHRHILESRDTFLEKLDDTLAVLESLVPACCRRHFEGMSTTNPLILPRS